ncbi:MAG: carbohydrate ABC transporter permease, partial [Leifsonia sp.]
MSVSTLIEASRRRARESAVELPPKSALPGPVGRTVGIAVLVVATLYFVAPVFWLMIASTKNNRDLTSTFGFWFAEWNLSANYESLMAWTQGMF